MTTLTSHPGKSPNVLTGGHFDRKYYSGGNARLDAAGFPIMNNPAGNDHVSEVTIEEFRGLLAAQGLKRETMPIMSGSKWFNRHSFLPSVSMLAEVLHSVFRFRSWAHGACMMVRVPEKTNA